MKHEKWERWKQKYIPKAVRRFYHRHKRPCEITGGIFLILLGIAGLVLPFLQGFLFLAFGVALISPSHGKKMFHKLEEGKKYLLKKWNLWRKKI